MERTDYKNIKPAAIDPIMGITEDEYKACLDAYLNNDNNIITMVDPNVVALLIAIAGANKVYSGDLDIGIAKSRGARK